VPLLQNYLQKLQSIHQTGEAVKETSYYPALDTLFSEAGATLKPQVRVVINLKNRGAGIPDGGFFPDNQLRAIQKNSDAKANPVAADTPERGVLEVKGAADDLMGIVKSPQVAKYLAKYGLVLVCNLRQFILVLRNEDGSALVGERFSVAATAEQFWKLSPQKVQENQGEAFGEYIRRALSVAAPLDSPQSLAWFLASYARDARLRVEQASPDVLHELQQTLEEALGLKFEGEKGGRFFRSTLVQTLFYGLFSAWISHARAGSGAPFNWKEAEWHLKVPMIAALYERVAGASQLTELDLVEPMQWAADALNRVQQEKFFEKFGDEGAVQYFYEPFLEAYDPQLRRELGVWYTPPEIVRYMVERVDTLLKTELGRPRGLADEEVYMLDPCCGTGAYPLEVLRRIHATLKKEGNDYPAAALRDAAAKRVFGFEILPAPFVVAHYQIGQLLAEAGAPFGPKQRAGVFLTNALTGWDAIPPELPDKSFQKERELAVEVKQKTPVLVILGNPPYNAFAGTAPEEEGDLAKPYKEGLVKKWGIKKFNLDDLYVRFFRIAEKKLTGHANSEGVLCFISNFSYTSEPSFVVMREKLLGEFDALWFDVLNGDSRETGKVAPDGSPDPSVFSTPFNREGIRVGTAIGAFTRRQRSSDAPKPAPVVRSRQFWGIRKREELLESLQAPDFNAAYISAEPTVANRFSFRPQQVAGNYLAWKSLVELCAVAPMNGLMEKRSGALIALDREVLEERMAAYFDPAVSLEKLGALHRGLVEPAARFEPKSARLKVLAGDKNYRGENLVRYLVRPFDLRFAYYSGVRPLWNEPRPSLWAQTWEGNSFLMTRSKPSKTPEGSPVFWTQHLSDDHALSPDAYCFPFFLRVEVAESLTDTGSGEGQFSLLGDSKTEIRHNLSLLALEYLASVGVEVPDVLENPTDRERAALLWQHALAIGFSPAYRKEHADGLRSAWPRVPLPPTSEILLASAALGSRVAALLDVSRPDFDARFKNVAVVVRSDGKQVDPDAGDVCLHWNWGYKSQAGVVMPGGGNTDSRPFAAGENDAYIDTFGATTLDLGLWRGLESDVVTRLSNVPPVVWEYTIGGYQVMKKWMSYRDKVVLGRALTRAEAVELSLMARKIASLVALEAELDTNYRTCSN
jgi:hypothetical protein